MLGILDNDRRAWAESAVANLEESYKWEYQVIIIIPFGLIVFVLGLTQGPSTRNTSTLTYTYTYTK